MHALNAQQRTLPEALFDPKRVDQIQPLDAHGRGRKKHPLQHLWPGKGQDERDREWCRRLPVKPKLHGEGIRGNIGYGSLSDKPVQHPHQNLVTGRSLKDLKHMFPSAALQANDIPADNVILEEQYKVHRGYSVGLAGVHPVPPLLPFFGVSAKVLSCYLMECRAGRGIPLPERLDKGPYCPHVAGLAE